MFNKILNLIRKDTLTLSDRTFIETTLKEAVEMQEKHISNIEVYAKAVAQFGNEHQLMKAVEESAEYAQAICKYLDSPDNATKNALLSEIADVIITMNQVKLVLGITDATVFQMVDHKTRKLAGYLHLEE